MIGIKEESWNIREKSKQFVKKSRNNEILKEKLKVILGMSVMPAFALYSVIDVVLWEGRHYPSLYTEEDRESSVE